MRRAILGYPKARKTPSEQREGDLDEVMDADFRTTGFSRPLKTGCNGEHTCDAVENVIKGHGSKDLLAGLWFCLVTAPLGYVSAGVINQNREDEIIESISLTLARVYSLGLVDELSWFLGHASFHAWQVNHLFEAAMFGSLLDDGALVGKLDRKDY